MYESPIKEFFRSSLKNFNFMIGAIMFFRILVLAVFADQIAPYEYDAGNPAAKLMEPCKEHLFGTDEMGRDLFSRIVYGARITLKVAIIGGSIQLVLGVVVGLFCGYFGGVVDKAMLFLADLTWCVPGMVMALAVVTVIGTNLNNAIIAIALVNWASMARTVRAKTMSLKNMAFIETGVAFGESDLSLMFRYILPNIVPALIVMVSMALPSTIMSTTTLSFLGVGSQPPSPDWGLMVSDGIQYITKAPGLAIYPGLALVYAVLSFTILGEGLRDLLDPRMKSQG